MTAVISSCTQFRYTLERDLGATAGPAVLFIMLNPSTADHKLDDPTVRRCIGFARAWSFSRLLVGNLYAFRATDPLVLLRAKDPVGPDNDRHLCALSARAEMVVCAWGASVQPIVERADEVIALLDRPLHCLALTKYGFPAHPLYQPKSATPARWGVG